MKGKLAKSMKWTSEVTKLKSLEIGSKLMKQKNQKRKPKKRDDDLRLKK